MLTGVEGGAPPRTRRGGLVDFVTVLQPNGRFVQDDESSEVANGHVDCALDLYHDAIEAGGLVCSCLDAWVAFVL